MGMSIQSAAVNLFQNTSSVGNMQQLQRTAGGAAEGAESAKGGVGQSNFLNAIMQALSQITQGTTPAAQTAAKPGTQNPAAALQSFIQTLSSALGQTGQGGDSDDGNNSTSGVASQGSNIANGIQNLLQQLSSPQNPGSDVAGSLNTSFQNLMSSMNSAQGTSTGNAPTLQSFLQNLMQNLGNGQNISGAMLNVQA